MDELKHVSIKNWNIDDRPREKMIHKGRSTLSDAELLAILLGTGTASMSAVDIAKQVLAGVHYNLNELATMSLKDLQKFKGIGEAKAIIIMSALELGRRRKDALFLEKPVIKSSSDAYQIMSDCLHDLPHEEFWIMIMSRANKVLNKLKISSGGITGTVVDPKIIFKLALEHLACGLILFHNHPSGNLKPSNADIELTAKLKQAGKVLEIPILDHIIYTNNGYYSFADEGIL